MAGKITITNEKWILKAQKVHGTKYDYSLVDYKGSEIPVKIICKEHGIFKQRPHGHLKGQNCPICSKIIMSNKITYTLEEFIKKANKKHNGFYDYSNTIYTKGNKKIIINCPLHGQFTQEAIAHLNTKGCKKCIIEENKYKFLKKATLLHNNFYNYELVNYIGCDNKVIIICPIHGEFLQTPSKHLEGCGCRKCNLKIKSKEDYINAFNKIHNFKYDYSLLSELNSKSKIEIICSLHGNFTQCINYHLIGGGCKKCSDLNNNYKKSDWVNRGKNKIGIFYIIKCSNENENFYKLGITFNSIKTRYSNRMPYNYEIIQEIKSNNLEFIWDTEKYFKKYINKQKLHYSPNIKFGGSELECYKL